MLNLINRTSKYLCRIAITEAVNIYSYSQLLDASAQIAAELLGKNKDLNEARIGYMIRPGFNYVSVQWGIWRAGGIAVPICVSYPAPSIQYVLEDAQVSQVVSDPEFLNLLDPLCKQLQITLRKYELKAAGAKLLPEISDGRRAMILYTSGTTGQPKGVVTTHKALEAQIKSLVEAWEWNQDDHILNILPLHHVHGIVNILCCALWSGACCEFLPQFDASEIFRVFQKRQVNLFMAVPTIYYKLIAQWESLASNEQEEISSCLKDFRLMVSGSAALPISTLEKWSKISGHILLERYGMTEMGMAISNSYHSQRHPGCIGRPLPGIEVRLVDDENHLIGEEEAGEIQIKGPNVFKEYWNKPDATHASFTDDGWFKTGDIAIVHNGVYKIIGRSSIDIIKSGGYKISALEIEEQLRNYSGIRDCAVVGIADDEWGELVVAALITDSAAIDLESLTSWIKDRLPEYKIPRKYLILDELPRNAMGKVTKHVLKELFIST